MGAFLIFRRKIIRKKESDLTNCEAENHVACCCCSLTPIVLTLLTSFPKYCNACNGHKLETGGNLKTRIQGTYELIIINIYLKNYYFTDPVTSQPSTDIHDGDKAQKRIKYLITHK